jgi:hypothetical protein
LGKSRRPRSGYNCRADQDEKVTRTGKRHLFTVNVYRCGLRAFLTIGLGRQCGVETTGCRPTFNERPALVQRRPKACLRCFAPCRSVGF